MQLLLEFHICLYDKSTSAVTNLGKSYMLCPFQMGQYTVTRKMFEKHCNLYIVIQHTEDMQTEDKLDKISPHTSI